MTYNANDVHQELMRRVREQLAEGKQRRRMFTVLALISLLSLLYFLFFTDPVRFEQVLILGLAVIAFTGLGLMHWSIDRRMQRALDEWESEPDAPG